MATVVEASGNSPIGHSTDQKLRDSNRTGTASPIGSLTPQFSGERYYDSTNRTTYIARGLTNLSWVLLYPAGGI
jgi:hypothetical protein